MHAITGETISNVLDRTGSEENGFLRNGCRLNFGHHVHGQTKSGWTLVGVSFLLFVLTCGINLRAGELDQFVQQKTEAFDRKLKTKESFGKLGTGYRFQFTSQTWKDRMWTHDLRLFVPQDAEGDIPVFMVVIGGEGSWKPMKMTAQFTEGTGYALALLGNVPRQPMFSGLQEDNLIAHTFVEYLDTGDTSWPLLFPMTRSVVRAMDALDGFAKEISVDSFHEYVVGGASKRGWTAWLTGAVDERVSGMIPMVYDNLNVPKQMQNQLDMWGKYSDKIKPYTKRNIPERLNSERGRKLVELVDPYSYRDRYEVPTLMISGTNDPFWPVNSVNVFLDELQHDVHQLYIPNAGHGVGEEFFNVANTIKAFLLYANGDVPFPVVRAEAKRKEDQVRITWSSKRESTPDQVSLWVARNDSTDYRRAEWKRKKLNPETESHVIPLTSSSHLACFLRFSFTLDGPSFQLSSRVFLFKSIQ